MKKFVIKLNKNHPGFELLGIEKRLNPQLEFDAYQNKKFNMYAERQINRLYSLKSSPSKYFRIVRHLIMYSNVFRVMAWNHVVPNWHKEMTVRAVMATNKRIDVLSKQLDANVDIHRVYIPKGDTVRPIGVPSLSWRIYLHMFGNFLYMYLENAFLTSQHGFIPGRGTLSAWRMIMSRKFLSKKYILAFDLKQFFPSVSLDAISRELMKYSVPENIVSYIYALNLSAPKLPAEEKLDEGKFKNKAVDPLYGEKSWVSSFYSKYFYDENFKKYAHIYKGSIYRWYDAWSYRNMDLPYSSQGVPQGSPLGPLLSLLVLTNWLKEQEEKGIDTGTYADDGLLVSDEYFEPPKSNFLDGIEVHPGVKKTHWVKFGGKWLERLKFLGLVWDHRNKSFYSETRNGLTEYLGKDMAKAINKIEHLENVENNFSKPKKEFMNGSWLNIFCGRYWGFVQARLYSGSDLEDFEQDFTYSIGKYSLMSLRRFEGLELDTFNASSYASKSLIEILRQRRIKTRRKMYGLSLNTERL